MNALITKQLDDRNEEIANVLISLGMNRPVAWTLSQLINRNEITSVELERETELRQPEVSIAMKKLKEHGWINEREEKKPGKGRPYKIYSLKVGFDEIIDQIEEQKKKTDDDHQHKMERLKELGR